MAYQTTFGTDPAIAYAGMPADSTPRQIESFIAEGAPVVGNLMVRGTDPARQAKPMTSLTAAATAILASGGASASTAQTISGAALNGSVGTGLITPAQQVTMTLSSHANWDATTAVFTYENAVGEVVSENVAIPDAGNTTISTIGAARRLIQVYIPAQSGTAGTFTLGTIPTAPVITHRNHVGVAMYDASRDPYTTGNAYTAGDPMNVISKGRVYVIVEDAVAAGDPVYVRTTTASSDVAGQFGGERAANFGLLLGARYVTAAAQDGLAIVELG